MATTLTSSADSKKRKFKQAELEEDDIKDSSSEDDSTDDEMDSDYDPNDDHHDYSSDEDNQIEESKMEPFSDRLTHKEPKYIVFHHQLLLLLSICHFCLSTRVNVTSVLFGSMLIAVIKCSHCKSVWEWSSQPKIRGLQLATYF